MMSVRPLLVIGHMNPDTDSICSAICCHAIGASRVHDAHALADAPPRLSDTMIEREAYEITTDNRFSLLPVLDGNDPCIGKVAALGIASPLSLPIAGFLEPPGPTFLVTSPIRDFEHTITRSNQGGFRLVLVDHNEFLQSVEGIAYESVEAIIDHQRTALQRTTEPITVIDRVVGSARTTMAGTYEQSGADLDVSTAGLLLSRILSGTVIHDDSPARADGRRRARGVRARALRSRTRRRIVQPRGDSSPRPEALR